MKAIGLKLFVVTAIVLGSIQINAQEIKGAWEGILNVQEGVELPIVFNISEKDGAYITTMDSPSQNAFDIPMDKTTYQEGDITIELAQAGIKYVGKLNGDKITGTFYQSGLELSLVMETKKE